MQMDLEHGLAAIAIAVHHDAVAVLIETLLLGVRRRRQSQTPYDFRMHRWHIVQCGEIRLRHEQHMHRRLRRDIVEREQMRVFVNDLRRYLAAQDFVEDGVGHVARQENRIIAC